MTPDAPPARKIAIVTGGSRGIGRAIVERLARAGLDVTFTFVANEAAARELESSLDAGGLHVRGLRVDARDAAACKAMVESVIAERGRVDVLVNNAAVLADRLLAMMALEDWTRCSIPASRDSSAPPSPPPSR